MASQLPDPWSDEGRPRWGCICAAVVSVSLVAGGIYAWYHFDEKRRAEAAITASSGRLTLANDDGDNLKDFDRRERPEVWYRITLENVPMGRKIALVCEWIDPNGTVAHQNRYETREIAKTPWPTHARCQFGPDSPIGRWTVRLSLAGRELHSATFELRDGNAADRD